MTVNIHGLPRDIPDPVKREVRQRCGFGCVICGLAIVEYEHVDPEYKDAKEHDPAAIALLCAQCHHKVTTKMWSKARVKLAMRAPKSKQTGHSNEFFDFCDGMPKLQFGGVLLSNCPVPIMVGGRPLFSIKPPNEPGSPFLLSGTFTDSKGNVSLEIEDNEWKAMSRNWDVHVAGPTIVVREAKGKIHLVLRASAPDTIIVERLDMSLAGYMFKAGPDRLRVETPGGGWIDFSGSVLDECQVGLSLP